MLLIVGLSFCSMTCADTCLIARSMAERSSPTAALNVISDHDSYSDWNDGSRKIAVNQVVKARNQPLTHYVVNYDIGNNGVLLFLYW